MMQPLQISIPTLVRAKDGALDRIGIYLVRAGHRKVAILISQNMHRALSGRVADSLRQNQVCHEVWLEVGDNSLECAARIFADLPASVSAIVGVGGGKALDVAKYVGFLSRRAYFAVPTSLSNDGFCSPQASLTIDGKRRSLSAALPYAVIVDTGVCLNAPRALTLSGIGDLVAKFTAVFDWKLSFHKTGEPVNDFSALLSDGSIHSFLSHPKFDPEGIRLLATSLMLNGIAMEICGSSRPASGSEHLISHALDAHSQRPRLHGLQVGIASYIVSHLQGANSDRIAELFDATGFWEVVVEDPFLRSEWMDAITIAPNIKSDFFTILSTRDCLPEVEMLLNEDSHLRRCFRN